MSFNTTRVFCTHADVCVEDEPGIIAQPPAPATDLYTDVQYKYAWAPGFAQCYSSVPLKS